MKMNVLYSNNVYILLYFNYQLLSYELNFYLKYVAYLFHFASSGPVSGLSVFSLWKYKHVS